MAQKLKESETKNIHFGVNAKVIHRSVGKFASSVDLGWFLLQIWHNKWKFWYCMRIHHYYFQCLNFSFTEKEKQVPLPNE